MFLLDFKIQMSGMRQNIAEKQMFCALSLNNPVIKSNPPGVGFYISFLIKKF